MDLKMSPSSFFKPRFYELQEFLRKAEITREQLVDMAILIGTDFNPEGFEGIGPKKAYQLIKKYGSLDELISRRKIVWQFDVTPDEIRNIFLNPPITDNYTIEFKYPDVEGVMEFLIEEYNFSRKRVQKELNEALRKIETEFKGIKQASLSEFFQ